MPQPIPTIIRYCKDLADLNASDVEGFGGKNASLGEMIQTLKGQGIRVPGGFAIHAEGYRLMLSENRLEDRIRKALIRIDRTTLEGLAVASATCRDMILHAKLPASLRNTIYQSYRLMGSPRVAVRSSATAEDSPSASFAGQHESFLFVQGEAALEEAIIKCYASLFHERAIKYRIDHDFDHESVALSIGVQRMVRSDCGSAGVAFTLDPETGFRNIIYITSVWGLGETIVQGTVTPDEFICFKSTLASDLDPILRKRVGSKEKKMIYTDRIMTVETAAEERNNYCLKDAEVKQLAQWCLKIEEHFQRPMDIEWALDGITRELFIVQARPETIHHQTDKPAIREYHLAATGKVLCTGIAVGHSIISGTARVIHSLNEADSIQTGDLLIAPFTHPDWNTVLRKAAGIITDQGGRTSHASIVARELGIPALVGTGNATRQIQNGQTITLSTATGSTGSVYDGKLEWSMEETPFEEIPETHTRPMLILADPDQAFRFSAYPSRGVGLLRMEFIIARHIRIHPMALLHPERIADEKVRKQIREMTKSYVRASDYFIEELAQAISLVAAAFYPREVIVRTSDFKSNEYESLVGGSYMETNEENPMLGSRGASRYYRDVYREAFGLECEAIRKVRDEKGLNNVHVMIPFCRTPEEARQVTEILSQFGLHRGKNGLMYYMMVEIPSNVLMMESFNPYFDGYSIGSNDLTQLTLGVDRDIASLSHLFDERNEAVKMLIRRAINAAKRSNKRIGLCGQAPSDHAEFARFLVVCGIDSISFNPDALLRGIRQIESAENTIPEYHEAITR